MEPCPSLCDRISNTVFSFTRRTLRSDNRTVERLRGPVRRLSPKPRLRLVLALAHCAVPARDTSTVPSIVRISPACAVATGKAEADCSRANIVARTKMVIKVDLDFARLRMGRRAKWENGIIVSACAIWASNCTATSRFSSGLRMSVAEGTSKLKCLVIAGPPASPVIGIGRVAETIAPLLPLMRPAELRRVLRIEDETATAQRLGFVLEISRQPIWPKSFRIGSRLTWF